MSEEDAFERILASLHEAALDPVRWPSTAALIDEALGTHGNPQVHFDNRPRHALGLGWFPTSVFVGSRRVSPWPPERRSPSFSSLHTIRTGNRCLDFSPGY